MTRILRPPLVSNFYSALPAHLCPDSQQSVTSGAQRGATVKAVAKLRDPRRDFAIAVRTHNGGIVREEAFWRPFGVLMITTCKH